MQRMVKVSGLALCVLAFSLPQAQAQDFDEGLAVRTKNWSMMLEIARYYERAGDVDLARRKYMEAWHYALSWAVYDPAFRDSGSRYAYGIQGLRTMRDTGPPAGLDMSRHFDDLARMLASPSPQVISGGPKNEGIWTNTLKTPFGDMKEIFHLKQHGGAITGQTSDGAVEFFGESFDGRTMTVRIRYRKSGLTGSGALTLSADGNTLSGRASFPPSPGGGPLGGGTPGDFLFNMARTWRE